MATFYKCIGLNGIYTVYSVITFISCSFSLLFLLFWFSHLFLCCVIHTYASLVAQIVKNLPAMQETWVQSLGWEDPLEECLATHSSILAWKTATDRRAWQATVHGVTESDMTEWLSTAHIYLHVVSFHWYIFILNRVLLPIFFNVENNQVCLQAINAGEGVEKRELSYNVGGNAN